MMSTLEKSSLSFINYDKINNNVAVKPEVKQKYTRSQLATLIRSPVKAGTRNILKLFCEHCNNIFTNKWSLQKHIKSEHKEATFLCTYCGDNFLFNSNLVKHVASMHEKDKNEVQNSPKEFKCTKCEKSLTSKVRFYIFLLN